MRFTPYLVTLSVLSLGCQTQNDDGTSSETESEEIDFCSVDYLRTDALENGNMVLDGIELNASTALADLTADSDSYEGETVQIEGVVVDMCDNRGCWTALSDGEGNEINLKVVDGEVDFRDEVDFDQYGIGEGEFEADGEHGSQVWITGAVFIDVDEECEL